MKKKLNKKKILYLLFSIIFTCILIYSIYNIIIWFKDNKETKNIATDVLKLKKKKKKLNTETNEVEEKIDFTSLLEKNNETIGWIKINNSIINYPIVKTTDNDFYLNHSFDKSSNNAGWIYADYRDSLDEELRNNIIYGHNRRDGSMFGSLKKVLDKEIYQNKDNLKVILDSLNANYEYEIYSAFVVKDENVENFLITSFSTEDQFKNYVNNTLKYNNIQTDVNIDNIKNIITLYTCHGSNKKLLVFAYKK